MIPYGLNTANLGLKSRQKVLFAYGFDFDTARWRASEVGKESEDYSYARGAAVIFSGSSD